MMKLINNRYTSYKNIIKLNLIQIFLCLKINILKIHFYLLLNRNIVLGRKLNILYISVQKKVHTAILFYYLKVFYNCYAYLLFTKPKFL